MGRIIVQDTPQRAWPSAQITGETSFALGGGAAMGVIYACLRLLSLHR
jgi:hypothetical protein